MMKNKSMSKKYDFDLFGSDDDEDNWFISDWDISVLKSLRYWMSENDLTN